MKARDELSRLNNNLSTLFYFSVGRFKQMSVDEREDNTIYNVVVNHEEQYSIWPADRENALGWKDAGKSGTKAECLAYIEEVWTDMRPLSLRKQMEAAAR
jgi:MbtH protein